METFSTSSLSPLLRWAGSKRASVKALADLYRPGSTYIEPFCGSAALFFYLAPRAAILADINDNLINFYRHCQTDPAAVWDIASNIMIDAETYYKIRDLFNASQDSLLNAAYFFYLNRTCFNGIYRTNKLGMFNVPYSGKRLAQFIGKTDFLTRASALGNVKFSSADFDTTLRQNANSKSFFFIDPPYAKSEGRSFTEYDQKSFKLEDLTRLLRSLQTLDEAGAGFVLTYDVSSLPFDPAQLGWRSILFRVTRNVGGFKASRRVATEIAITNLKNPND
ncbi:Dam family site-specific DNA-(adenine-N6)-methyltransferase [Mesorhizobium sp. M0494]|uniref:DNA adenine methylase n=1 Tax=Mesorhizobium sp. M0494 TaxID=2956951 RepID=UPI0033393E03